ncbi:TonB-dependent receptor [candidate division KSB1 bacterium]|nr:TonB-dependent receptor [candidate division KSB1 bacterium]RQW01774.1 MAG: TonB-dependent receptor [candidate division KSB1 bacterium]
MKKQYTPLFQSTSHAKIFCRPLFKWLSFFSPKPTQVFLSVFLFSILAQSLHASTIDGLIENKADVTPLANANISIAGTTLGTISNEDGAFILSDVPPGKINLEISYIGFETRRLTLNLSEDENRTITIQLTPHAVPAGELVVTSTRYERALRDVALPLVSVNKHHIERAFPRDVSEAVATAPGLSITRDGVWGTHVAIRGLSRNNIVMMIDGNRIDTANDLAAGLSMIDINDVERIEVIKGAGSSLYGTGAIGGVVNIQTKDATYADNFYIRGNVTGGYSSVNQSTQGFFAVQSGGLKWHAKVTGMNRSAQDAQTPLGVLPNSHYNETNIAARIGFKPSAFHEFLLNWQQYRGTNIGIPGGNSLFPGTAEVRYPRENRDLFSAEYIARNVTPALTKISLKYFKQDILRDVENIPHMTKNMPDPPKQINVLKIVPAATHATTGLQLQSDWLFYGHHLIAGIDAWGKDMDSFRKRVMRIDVLKPDGSVANSIDQIIGERPIPLSSYRSAGFFLQDEKPLWTNRLTMTLGGRFDAIHVENEKTLQPVYVTVNGEQNDHPPDQMVMWEATTANDNSWSGNLGLLYKASADMDVTLTVARSFRSPYLEERYQYIDLGNVVKIGDPNLKPEQGLFADIGLRYWGKRVTLVGNVFINQIKNMVAETAGDYEGRNALFKTNIGSAELYGADVSLDMQLYKSIHFFGSAAYVHGTDTFLGEPLPLVPPLNGRLGLRSALSRFLEFECAARVVGTQDRVADWELTTPGYTVFDLFINSRPFALARMQSQLFFGLSNIFDRSYRDHLSTNRGAIAIEPGRNISVKWQLGI